MLTQAEISISFKKLGGLIQKFDVLSPMETLKRFAQREPIVSFSRFSLLQMVRCTSPNGILKMNRTTRCTRSRRSTPTARLSTSGTVQKAILAMGQVLHWRKSGNRFWSMFSRITLLFSVTTTRRANFLPIPLTISGISFVGFLQLE